MADDLPICQDSCEVKSTDTLMNGKATGSNLECEHFSNSGLEARHDQSVTTSSRSSEGKPSDSAISLNSVDPNETEHEEISAKRKLLEEYFTDRIATLTKSLQHATSRAAYYKQECEELIRKSFAEQAEVISLQKKIRELEDKCALLNETLETTQQSYEEQMKQLHEHMAGQDAKIMAQAEQLGVNGNGPITLRQKQQADARNGQSSKDGKRSSWFSSSQSSSTTK